MDSGTFYFLSDQYFIDFPDEYLMKNKEIVNGIVHDRPCYYVFEDDNNKGLFWMIPISSRIQKYLKIYNDKRKRFSRCDTIVFGKVLGHKKAFLIQNICPVTSKYITNQYIDLSINKPVRISSTLHNKLIAKAKTVLALHQKGKKIVFPDIDAIKQELLKTLR